MSTIKRKTIKSRVDPGFSLSHLDRTRWNVVDLITVVARRAVPMYLVCEIDMTKVEGHRLRLKQQSQRITETAYLLKAIAIAQRDFSRTRSVMLPLGRTATFNDIVAGFTVERMVDGKPSVFIGTIESPDQKPLHKIAAELRDYAHAAICDLPCLDIQYRFSHMPWLFRQFILWLGLRYPCVRQHLMPATFGVSSLGKYGVTCVTGPCVATCTFGVGAVERRPVVADGRMEVRPMMALSLACNLNVVDGSEAAQFLGKVKALMESGLEDYLIDEESLTPSRHILENTLAS